MYWSMIELGLSITAACLPTLRPLFRDSSFEGWYKALRSYITTRYKSLSTQSNGFSTFDVEAPNELRKGLEQNSNSSQVGVLAANNAQMTTDIYPLHDVEAQTGIPSASITVRSKIEQTSYVQ